MKRPVIRDACVESLLETRYIKVFDLQYEEGKHYYDATRHERKDLIATKTDEEFQAMQADAVTCFVVIKTPDEEPRLLLFYEYRYPTGRYLLSPPAGLMDEEDRGKPDSVILTAKREIMEETGIVIRDTDEIRIENPLVFSTPGMTDECNALVSAVVNLPDLSSLNQSGAVGSEVFGDFCLLTKEKAREILKNGRDEKGNFFSVYTYAALQYFVGRDF